MELLRTHLGQEVEWHPRKKDIREILGNTKGSIHNPVGQPLCVIVLVNRVNGLAPAQENMITGSKNSL